MSNGTFETMAEEILHNITEKIEIADNDYTLEIDYQEGVLYIELSSGEQYTINKHAPSAEIWLSSPFSGAHHFAYDENEGAWIDSDSNELYELLSQELLENAQITVRFG